MTAKTTNATNVERGRILVADDDAVTRRLLSHHLQAAGFEVVPAVDGRQALALLAPDLVAVLLDLQMPGASGTECLRALQQQFPNVPAIMISQFGEIADAVDALHNGAADFLTKPVDPDVLLARVQKSLRNNQLRQENQDLRQALGGPMPATLFQGQSSAMAQLMNQAHRVAELDGIVLIAGETGTGKTTLARWIHQNGPRRGRPYIDVSCTTFPRDLIEDQLFGHVRGAFTGATADRPGSVEMADGGSLFLDEIGDLPLELQSKLLTFLDNRTFQRIGESRSRRVDARVIAATNQSLENRVRERAFREDLYFRLNVLTLAVPPLRDRADDIPRFAEHILAQIARKRGGEPFKLSKGATAALQAHSWPGNVRDLQNVLERATAFASGSVLEVEDLRLQPIAPPSSQSVTMFVGKTLRETEKMAILATLDHCGGNKKAAAHMLGIDEKTIHNKLKSY